MRKVNVVYIDSDGISREQAYLYGKNTLVNVYPTDTAITYFADRDLAAELALIGELWINVEKDDYTTEFIGGVH